MVQNGSEFISPSISKLLTAVLKRLTLQEARKQVRIAIKSVYEGYVSHSIVSQSLIMPHVRHLCVLLPLVLLNTRQIHLGLHT